MATLMLLSAAGLLLITVLVFRQLLFRLHCHPPLPPGPKGWPVVGCLPLLGAAPPHVALARMAQTHGPIMYLKLGSYGMVIASKPAAVRAFLKTQDRNFSNRPPNAGATHIGYEAQDLVFAAHGPRWTFIRKLSNLHMLGPKSFNDWAPIREAEIGLMIREVYGYGSDRVVPLPETAICAIANVIGQRSLSRRVFASSAESTEFKEMVVEAMRLSGSFNVGDFIPAVAWMDLQGIEGQMKRLHKKFDKLLTEMIEEHSSTKKDREENPDFLDFVTAAGEYSDGLKLTETHIKAILLNLFVAGTDTSASTVEWAMAEMLKNPAILNEAHKEMDRVIGKDRRIREADMSDLPYLQAICKEAFRMHPSVPLSLPRVSSAACEVDGYHIPRGTRLLVNLWAIGRDPEVWKDPAEFKPARFLAGGEGEGIDPMGNDFELTPFGAGRRICVGIRMGIAMVEHLLGALVHGFEWEMPEGVADVDMEERFGLVLQMAVPLRAVARPRLALAAYEI